MKGLDAKIGNANANW